MKDISIGDKVLDSRDVIKKYEELQEEFEVLKQAIKDACEDWDNNREDEGMPTALKDSLISLKVWSEWDEYENWKEFCEQGESISDWIHGTTLIHDDYFEQYAMEFARDIGAVDENWPNNCIDWKKAANQLKLDYTTIEVDENTYWGRS